MTNQPHSQRAHALLSASTAHRWIHCTPAPHLEENYPDTTSSAADQGTAAHELAEHKLRLILDQPTTRPESEWVDEEMEECTDYYADNITAEYTRAHKASPAAFLAIEERVDFSHIVPEGFGTADAIIVADDTLTIIDFKYGKGVKVSAVDNPQMKLYALGALKTYGMIYNIHHVRMIICQPRIDNLSIADTTVAELEEWADTVARPAAHKAWAGEGEPRAGAWCTFCKHAPRCSALAAQHFAPIPLEASGAPQAPNPATLTDAQLATIVTHSKALKKWLGEVEKYAEDQALSGHVLPGVKLVEGRSVRKFTDESKVAEILEAAGVDPWQKKLTGLTALTRQLGKKKFDDLLGDYITKPPGAPTLVPEDDPRPAIQALTAQDVFQQLEKDT